MKPTLKTDITVKDICDGFVYNELEGKGLFGLDFYREGMVNAMIQRPPAFGTKIKSVDAAAAKVMPGIIDVITFKNNVAIVGLPLPSKGRGPG